MRTTAWMALVWIAVAAQARAGERLTTESLLELARVGTPEVSPDGNTLCFDVTHSDLAKNASNSDVWLLATAGGAPRQLTTHEKADRQPRWSPDGMRIGFLSARAGAPQVFTIDPTGGEAVQLTRVEKGADNFAWAPDGKSLSFTSAVRIDPELKTLYPDLPLANARIIDDLLYRHWDTWNDGTYSHLFVLSLEPGAQPRDLMAGERFDTPLVPNGGPEEIAWAPDSSEICYTAKKCDQPARRTDSDLYVVPVAGGPARCITEGMDGADRYPLYSPDGRWIAFESMERPTFEADRVRLMLFERATGKIRELPVGFDFWAGDLAWSPDSSGLYFTSVARGASQIFKVGLDGNWQMLTAGVHNLSGVAVSPDGKTLYAARCSMLRPNELVSLASTGGALATLTDFNGAAYAKLELPSLEERWVKAKDGKDVLCWLLKPPGFDPARKYPLLTYCQGGPQSPVSQFFSSRWNFHLMAAHGYVVIAPNRRGLPGFGQAWNDEISRHWGGLAMDDYCSATDAMFEEPWIDRKRAGAVGASFGGYSVFWLMGHNDGDRFATMVAHAGIFDLESFYAVTEELWFPDWDLGGPYWESAELQQGYDANSPHRFVAHWHTPLLVMHGEKDFRVPVGEGMAAFTAAKLRGVPSRFVCFSEANHWVTGVQDGVLWQRMFFDWLDRTLKPGT